MLFPETRNANFSKKLQANAKQFNDLVTKLDRTKTHVMLVRRGDNAQFVPIRPAASAAPEAR